MKKYIVGIFFSLLIVGFASANDLQMQTLPNSSCTVGSVNNIRRDVYLNEDNDGDSVPDLDIYLRSNREVNSNSPLTEYSAARVNTEDSRVLYYTPESTMLKYQINGSGPYRNMETGVFERMSRILPYDTLVRGMDNRLNQMLFEAPQQSINNNTLAFVYRYNRTKADRCVSGTEPNIWFNTVPNPVFNELTVANYRESLIGFPNANSPTTNCRRERNSEYRNSDTCAQYDLNRCGNGETENGQFAFDVIANEQCDNGQNNGNQNTIVPGIPNTYCSDTCQIIDITPSIPPTLSIDKKQSVIGITFVDGPVELDASVGEYYYRITASAQGGNTDAGNLRIVDNLPQGIEYISADGITTNPNDPSKISCQYIGGSSRTIDCNWRDVSGGDIATVTFKVRITSTSSQFSVTNRACLEPQDPDICDTTTTTRTPPVPPTLSIEKTQSQTLNENDFNDGPVTLAPGVTEYYYRITARAQGGNTTIPQVPLEDIIPNGLEFVAGSLVLDPNDAQKLQCNPPTNTGVLSCMRRNVVSNESATITFKVRIANPSNQLTVRNEACFLSVSDECDDTTTTYNPPVPGEKICSFELLDVNNNPGSLSSELYNGILRMRTTLQNYPDAQTVQFVTQVGGSNLVLNTKPYSNGVAIISDVINVSNLITFPLDSNPLAFFVVVRDAQGNIIQNPVSSNGSESCNASLNIEPECVSLTVKRNGVILNTETLAPGDQLETSCTVDFASSVSLNRLFNNSPLNPLLFLNNATAPDSTVLRKNQIFTNTFTVGSAAGNIVVRCDVKGKDNLVADQISACTKTFQVVQPGQPGLTIAKTNDVPVANDGVSSNSIFNWFVDYSNNGDAEATNVVITDILPAGVEINGPLLLGTQTLPTSSFTVVPQANGTTQVTIQIGTVNQNTNGRLTIPVRVTTESCTTLRNTANITATGLGPIISTDIVTCAEGDLGGKKEQSLDGQSRVTTDLQVAQNDILRYRVRYTHGIGSSINGNLIDIAPAGTSVLANSIQLTQANGVNTTCSVSQVSGRDKITCPNLILSSSNSLIELVFQVTIDDTQTYNRFSNGGLDFDSTINDYSTYFLFGTEKRRTNQVHANTGQPNITVQKSFTDMNDSPITVVRPGDQVKFRLRVTNNGGNIATDVLVCDRMPAQLTYGNHTPSTVTTNPTDANCAGNRSFMIPTLNAGQSSDIIVTATVSQTAVARFCNYAYARWRASGSTVYDQQSPEVNACLDISNPQPNLWINKEFVDPTTRNILPEGYIASPGDIVWIRLQYRNFEDVDASVVTIMDETIKNNTSRQGMIFTGVYVAEGTIPLSAPSGTDGNIRQLLQPLSNSDGFQTLYIQVQIDPTFNGTQINNAAIIELNSIFKMRDTDILNVQQIDIDIEKTADKTIALQGEEIVFTLKYTNLRNDVGVETYSIRDFLPPTLEYVAGSATINTTQSVNPQISTDPVTGIQTLLWTCGGLSSSLGTSCLLPPTQSRTIVFKARVR